MSNFHSDSWIMEQVKRHYQEALTIFPEDRIVGVWLQGSQNYGLDYENSDIDTKCIVLPLLEDLIFNRKPISTTHILPNGEHIDFKDVRLYFSTFRKQNLNFMEILFTKYKIVNPIYNEYWDVLIKNNEQIAHYNSIGAVKTMKGIALEKYYAMEHKYPSKIEIIERFDYDPKQLSHLIRVREYLERYIAGEKYADCLITKDPNTLIAIKRTDTEKPYFSLPIAREIAEEELKRVNEIVDKFNEENKNIDVIDYDVETLLDEVQRKIVTKGIKLELRD